MEVKADRIANCILGGLGKEYQEVKYGLRARSGDLKVEVVTQHLLATEIEMNKEKENVIKRPTYPGHHDPRATAMPAINSENCSPCSTVRQCATMHIALNERVERGHHSI